MSVISSGIAGLIGEPDEGAFTRAVDDTLLSSSREMERRAAWDVVVGRIVEWGRDPQRLEDEGNVPPSFAAVRRAGRFALILRDDGARAPDWAVALGDGGIAFRWAGGTPGNDVTLEIDAEGGTEAIRMEQFRIVSRTQLI